MAALVLGTFVAIMPSSSARADTEFQFAEPLSDPDDVYLWPLNLHLGYGHAWNDTRSAGGFLVGVDALTLTYPALVIDTVTVRASIRDSGGDVFIGTRVLGAIYAGDSLEHQFALGLGIGWGSIGSNFEDRLQSGDGQWVLGPTVRYTYRGLVGLEVAVHQGFTGDISSTLPTMITISGVGLGGVWLAFLTH